MTVVDPGRAASDDNDWSASDIPFSLLLLAGA